MIAEVLNYQALQPNNPYSSFKNLNQDEIISTEQMVKRVYLGNHYVTFQTCIEKDVELSWGHPFVIAVPKPEAIALNLLSLLPQ